MQIKNNNNNTGYTIIETMIAISLFLVIVTIGLGALLNANALHKRSQSTRSIMDNLSFIMEDMSRNIRTGSNYYCNSDLADVKFGYSSSNCPSSNYAIAFESSNGDKGNYEDQWGYYIENDGSLRKTINGGISSLILTPSEIKIDNTSGFTVVGAESSDTLQPLVTIRLSGTITDVSNGSLIPFSLQTSVSQRLLDR